MSTPSATWLVVSLALATLATGCTCDGARTDAAAATDAAIGADASDDAGGGTDAGSDSAVGSDGAATDGAATDGAASTPCGTMSCNPATQICVVDVAFGMTYACETVPPGCEVDRTCACVGTTLCTGGFDICIDPREPNTVYCECPTC